MSSEHDAAHWFARMRGPDAPAARAQFEIWYANPRNAATYDQLVRSWDQAKFLANTPTGRARNLQRASSSIQRRTVVLGTMVAAAICLCLFLVIPRLYPLFGAASSPPQELASTGDEPRVITLADGSRVTLDRASRLVVEFSAEARRLRLVRGRVRFEVAHDRTRPFVVEAGSGKIIAHGTVFDVAMNPEGVEVVLLQGAVEARARAGGVETARRLVPGQKLRMSGGRLSAALAITAHDTDWPKPMIEFNAVPLQQAVAAFNQMGRRKIVVDGVIAPDARITGAFRRDEPEAFAASVAAVSGLSLVRDDPRILRLVAAPEAGVQK